MKNSVPDRFLTNIMNRPIWLLKFQVFRKSKENEFATSGYEKSRKRKFHARCFLEEREREREMTDCKFTRILIEIFAV